jgi:GMP synthase (glutamine-hydrolysing)
MSAVSNEVSKTKRPILVILRQAASTPGRAGDLLRRKGFKLDIRRPTIGESLPETLQGYAGVISFGGPMSANDPDINIKREIDWLSIPLTENCPYFGICLGAQMLVKQLGGKVAAAAGEITEIGWYPLKSTEAGERILPAWPNMVYHFHREGFELPQGSTLLAEGDAYRNQAFRYGENAWGVQFHPELTLSMMRRWVVKGAHRFSLPNAQQGEQHLNGRLLYDKALRNWLNRFIDIVFATGRAG